MSKKPSKPSKVKRIPKSVQISKAVSRRFDSPEQELKIQTIAGALRELAASKGGHNSKKEALRGAGEQRVKKISYGKKAWGTLGSRVLSSPEVKKGRSPAVIKQFQKQESYRKKITSRNWRKAAGNR